MSEFRYVLFLGLPLTGGWLIIYGFNIATSIKLVCFPYLFELDIADDFFCLLIYFFGKIGSGRAEPIPLAIKAGV